MSSITHLLFVVVWYCKQIWFQQQSWTSHWYGNDYWGRWNLHPFSSQQSALCLGGTSNGNIPRWSSDWDWHSFGILSEYFFPPPKESAFVSSRQDYDAVETERFNHWEWQYLGRNRAYLTVFSFVLMRLYFASFLGSLPLTLCSCQAVKSSCKNTHMSHMLIRFALNHDRDYTVRTVATKLWNFQCSFCVFQQQSSPSCESGTSLQGRQFLSD